jgi:uncharacterized protein (DUF1697 family)
VPRYAAFLRGINVGGHRITSEELRSAFGAMGFEGAGTFRASGNVVFDADGGRPAGLASLIEQGLAEALGYAVPTFVRTAAQVRAIAVREPFDPKLVEASAGKLQVLMLSVEPEPQARELVLGLATADDRLAVEGSELYWLPSGGILDSDLDLKAIVDLLGPTTQRTKNTVDQMAAKFFA